MAGNAGSSNSDCGKPHVRCGITCCNFVRTLTGITAIIFFAWSAKAVHGALSALLLRKHRVRHLPPFVFTPDWRDVVLADITPSLAFFGLRNTAWAGHIVLKNAAGEWRLVVSSWGRIRLCERNEAATCQ